MEQQEKLSDLLEEIDEWGKADDEDEIDLFHQKSLIYRLLLRESPISVIGETIVRKHLKLLNQNEIQKEYTSEWFLEFKDLRTEISELKSKEQQQKLVAILENSNISAVNIYLNLEKILNVEKIERDTNIKSPTN